MNEEEEQAPKSDRRKEMALKSKMVKEIEDQEEEDNDEYMAMYVKRFS